ncbi:hypothetical protein BSNK01_24490 [Bacillaceae bacterium]
MDSRGRWLRRWRARFTFLAGKRLPLNLTQRIVLPYLTMLFVVVGVVGYISVVESKESLMKQVEGRLEAEALKIVEKLTLLQLTMDGEQLEKRMRYEMRQQQGVLAQRGLTVYQAVVVDGKLQPIPGVTRKPIPFHEDVVEKMWQTKRGVVHDVVAGKGYTIGFNYSPERKFVYLLAVEDGDYMGAIEKVRNAVLTAIFAGIVLSCLFGWRIAKAIVSPVHRLIETMKKISEGDLTQTCEISGTGPEIRALAQSFNGMTEQMAAMLRDIQETARRLREFSARLRETSQFSDIHSQQIVDAMQVVNRGAEQTAASTEQTVHTYTEMKGLILSLIGQIEASGETSSRMIEDVQEGKGHLANLLAVIQGFAAETEKVHAVMKQLQNESASIERIVTLIRRIAGQTKLLALNAQIEAARAGEAGRGFSVVAQEVRNLADETEKSAAVICELVANMLGLTKDAVKQTAQAMQEVESGQRLARDAEDVFGQMIADIEQTNGHVQSLLQGIAQVSACLDDVGRPLSTFATIAQETLARAQEMMAASEAFLQSAQNANRLSLELTTLSANLQAKTDRFRVRQEV